MISSEYCVLMARYNRWQNRTLLVAAETLAPAERARDRGAYFGSISGTLSHLLWADLVWMSRFDGGRRPEVPQSDSAAMFESWDEWRRERQASDARILDWAGRLAPGDLEGDLYWHSAALGRAVSRPMALCVAHFFNHQTHHRGQVHAMLTAAGAPVGVSDLLHMPHEADWM